jgi:arsenite methyltransferase
MSNQEHPVNEQTIKKAVEQRYAAIARGEIKTCCNTANAAPENLYNIAIAPQGYSAEKLGEVPAGADLGLGCGDPTADANLQPGQTVLDLGSGAGVDCFLAARQVGPAGRVIGVDMTDAMLEKARANAELGGFTNVEFRKGEIEHLPVESGTVDRIISNCVINLAPDKARVFQEAYRVLKPGGEITLSDIVSFGNVPSTIRTDLEKWSGCIAGALDREEYLKVIRRAGFSSVSLLKEVAYDYLRGPDYGFASITVRAVK